MHQQLLRLGFTLTCSTLAVPCIAETALPSEVDFFAVQPIVISASRLAQPLSEAPAAVTVIDREMIEASGFIEIADLLRLVPGFQVGLSSWNSSIAATYHGQSDALPRRMEVLVDGRSVYISVLNVDWHDLGVELADVDRIEVVRGPSSPVYGANAFTATVNIITRPRYADPGWFASATAGSTHARKASLRHVGNLSGLDYRLSLGYDQSDGFTGRDDAKRLRSINLRGWYDLGRQDSVDFQVGFHNGPMGRGGDDPLFNPLGANVGENPVASNHQKFRWSRVLSAGRDTSVQFYHQGRRERDDASLGLLSDVLNVAPALIPVLFPGHADEAIHSGLFDYTDERYDLEWQFNDATHEQLQWAAGAGLRLDKLKSGILLGRDDFVQDRSGRLFADAAYRLTEDWMLNAGGMLEHGDTLDREFSYRIALNRQLSPSHTVRGSVTRSVRKNSLLAEYMHSGLYFSNGDPINLVGHSQGGLKPEEMLAWDLGWLGNWRERHLTMEMKAFREEIREEIRAKAGPIPGDPANDGGSVMLNGGGVNLTGLEGQLRYRPRPGTLAALQFSLARAEDRYDPFSTGLFSNEGRTPRKTFSLLLAQTLRNDVQVSLGYYHIDEMRWEGAGEVALGKPPVPAYDRIDLRVAKRLHWPGKDVLLEFIAQNVGNDAYQEFRADNLFDTRYFMRVSAQFN